ncbi:hypothetical protein PR202_gb00398 [Eleusine coracana subsp. coracana]|uniref:Uncharacterized protein n=1 Tax=Eleusine coracana subsp. coracana TaxID=191504 RepID=A0AAV5DT09_ELECO|nr:hypothetical protein PR202_gb00398 [Eleusine coracana subsp. coracana]
MAGAPGAGPGTGGAGAGAAGAGLKAYFKTPEGRYKLQYEKTHSAVPHYGHGGRTVSQVRDGGEDERPDGVWGSRGLPLRLVPLAVVRYAIGILDNWGRTGLVIKVELTVAYLKEKPASQGSAPSTPSSSSGMRSAAARFLGAGNGNRAGGNGGNRVVSGSSRVGGGLGTYTGLSGSQGVPNYDGKGTYIIFNSADTLFISDLNSPDKDPIKSIHFSNSNPLCHAFDPEAKDGHDLIVGMGSGDVYSMSLRQQLQDLGRKPVAAQHYNKGDKDVSRCTSVAWVPDREGFFVASHSDGNLYVYDKNKDGNTDCTFPAVKDQSQFMISHAKSSKCNPVARWHICQGSINAISFSPDGAYLATVGRDGYLRVFDFPKEQLVFGGRSYYGALLCCTWSSDGKYLLTGGEDDLVQVWSMDDRKIVAWGEGHNSWVSGVAFDSYWSPPSSDGTGENVYRFGSVGQMRLLPHYVIFQVARQHFSSGSPSAHWDSAACPPTGVLQPSPKMRHVPKLSPLVAHRVHVDPLSGLVFTNESIVTICREGLIKIWARPGEGENDQPSNSSEFVLGSAVTKDRAVTCSNKTSGSSFKKPSSVLIT